MGQVNAVAAMFPTAPDEVLGVNATLDGVLLGADGNVAKMKSAHQLCDRVVASDAIVKLRLAAANLRKTGQPFWLGASRARTTYYPIQLSLPLTNVFDFARPRIGGILDRVRRAQAAPLLPLSGAFHGVYPSARNDTHGRAPCSQQGEYL